MCRTSIFVCLAVFLGFAGQLPAQMIFDNGGDHTVTGEVTEDVYVLNQSHVMIDATYLHDVYVTDAIVDHLNGNLDLRNIVVSENGVFNSRVRGSGRYKVVDSNVNFYEGLRLEGDALDASGTSIVQLLSGDYWETTGERIKIRGDSQILVTANAAVYVPTFMYDYSHGDATNSQMSSIVLSGHSSFNVNGGVLHEAQSDDNWSDGWLRLYDDARFAMSDGELRRTRDNEAPAVVTNQRSHVMLQNVKADWTFPLYGAGASMFRATGESLIQIDSGEYQLHAVPMDRVTGGFALIEDAAQIVIRGGIFEITGLADFGNGQSGIFELNGNSRLSISGGVFRSDTYTSYPPPLLPPHVLFTSGNSQADISGGTFEVRLDSQPGNSPELRHLEAIDTSTITLHGTGFNYPFGSVSDTEGTITGFLMDGSPFEWNFFRESSARILLVPEPSVSWLLVGGITPIAALLRRGANRRIAVVI
ncbi:MAG: hypothetical protein KDB23_22475 [Planctomycetales bacterium]|nr:hypothetical protein [Planctomycetales bacterium]